MYCRRGNCYSCEQRQRMERWLNYTMGYLLRRQTVGWVSPVSEQWHFALAYDSRQNSLHLDELKLTSRQYERYFSQRKRGNMTLLKCDRTRQSVQHWYTREISSCDCCILRLSGEVLPWITILLNLLWVKEQRLISTWGLKVAPKLDQTLWDFYQIHPSHSVGSQVSHHCMWGYEWISWEMGNLTTEESDW